MQTTITFNSDFQLSPVLYQDARYWKQKFWANSNNKNFLLGCSNLVRASVFIYERLDILRDTIGHPSKSYCRLNLLRASFFNFEGLNILRDSIRHPRYKSLSSEFTQSFCFQCRASRYIRTLNRTSMLKVIVVWICYELQFSITSVSIYYGTQSDIPV